MEINSAVSWLESSKSKTTDLILNEKDIAYLELQKYELKNLPVQFRGMSFKKTEDVYRAIIKYSQLNLCFAAKIFLKRHSCPKVKMHPKLLILPKN